MKKNSDNNTNSKKSNLSSSKISNLKNRKDEAKLGGGAARQEAQHSKGKKLARERLSLLFDNGQFTEIDPFVKHNSSDFGLDKTRIDGDSVICGYGNVHGQQVFAFSQDFTVLGGSLSKVASNKICKAFDLAIKTGCPIVGINDSGGARIQEGVDSLSGYGELFKRNTMASGVIPQITVVVGPSAGGAVYSPALTDFIFMVDGVGQMYITGPEVVKAVTGEDVSHDDLGGANAHSTKSGVAHFVSASEDECFDEVRNLINILPSNNVDAKTNSDSQEDYDQSMLDSFVPESPNQSYDVKEIINTIIDPNSFLEVQESYAQNIVIGFSKFNGETVGIVANQPDHMAGALDINASSKAARFVRFCDSFNIPIVSLVDVPGFMPGTAQEYGGIIRHGAKLLYAYVEATVPKITIIMRKAYGGAYIVMGSKELRCDVNVAWPSAEIAVMGPEGAVNIIGRKEISSSEDPEKKKQELIDNYRDKFATPFVAAEKGYLDDVIEPSQSRQHILNSLNMLRNKVDHNLPKKHGNIPL
tara:strand:+ start:436 stop:2022 length:1587 start_codon:yes stop_codon:yes gene_type:complete